MSARRRDIYWSPWDEPGLELLSLALDAEGARASGVILHPAAGRALRCRYALESDQGWRLRRLDFEVADGNGAAHATTLESDGAGAWRVEGQPAPSLAGCLDVDIQVTPFTNSLPIRRLELAAGQSAEIRVAYLPVPELAARPAEQRYRCLAALGPNGGRYRYEGLFRGFTAELAVDADGLVIDYPETFRRVWPR